MIAANYNYSEFGFEKENHTTKSKKESCKNWDKLDT